MSNNEENKKEGLDEAKKEEIRKLLQKLGHKYKSHPEASSKNKSSEVGQTISQEVSDTTFIDVPDYTENRSRYIERKYGLKPMNEIISPKTEEEKLKELEIFLKKNNNPLVGDAVLKASRAMTNFNENMNRHMEEIRKEEDSYPIQYKWFEDMPGYRPEVNIGQKWANALEEQVKRDTEMSTSLRRGGYMYQSWKKGKIGVDKYFIIFGLLGAFILPLYIYNRHKTYKEFILKERGMKPGEELDLENGPFELDDISVHKVWYQDQEEKVKSLRKLTRKNEIRRLEEEIYGPEAFGAKKPSN
jgi:hypothetical protein